MKPQRIFSKSKAQPQLQSESKSESRYQTQQKKQLNPSQQQQYSHTNILDPNFITISLPQNTNNSIQKEQEIIQKQKSTNLQNQVNNINKNDNIKQNTMKMVEKVEMFQCLVCGQNKKYDDQLSYCMCEGKFCIKCTVEEIESRLKKMQDPTCPCGKILNIQSGFLYDITPEMYERYLAMRFRNEINENNFKMCRDGCETGILAEKTRNKNSVFACIMCETAHCPKCLEKSHVGNCDNRILLDLITANNYCFCTKCKRAVFKDGGCNFMKCSCKYSFCEICWGSYPDQRQPHICAPQNQQQKTKIIAQLKKEQLSQQQRVKKQQLIEIKLIYWKYFYYKLSECIRGHQQNPNRCKNILFFLIVILFFWIFIILYSIAIFVVYYGIIVGVFLYCKMHTDLIRILCNGCCSCVLNFMLLVSIIVLLPVTFICIYIAIIVKQCQNQIQSDRYIYYKHQILKRK